MVPLLEEAFRAVGKRVPDYVTLKQLDPAYHAHFADGSTMLVRAGHEAMRAEIAAHSGAKDAAAFDKFVVWLKRLNDVELPHFIDANFDSPLSLFRSPHGRGPSCCGWAASAGWARQSGVASPTTGWCGCSASRPCTRAWHPPRRWRSTP